MKTIFEVRTSKFHGNKLVSRHRTAESAEKARKKHDCNDCRCGGNEIHVAGKVPDWFKSQGGQLEKSIFSNQMFFVWYNKYNEEICRAYCTEDKMF